MFWQREAPHGAAGELCVAGEKGGLAELLCGLVGRISRGEASAEQEFMARYRVTACAIAARHCRPNEPQLDDIVQDVLTAVLAKLRAGAIHDPIALPHYLQQSLKHACLAHYQSVEKARERHSDTPVESVPQTHNDPVDLMEHRQRKAIARALVEALPQPRDREVLRRFYILEESRETICRTLQIDEPHFRKIMSRARTRLRELADERGML